MRRLPAFVLSAALLAGACDGGVPTATPTPSPTPAATATATAWNVENCFTQTIPGSNGQTLRSLIVPDVLLLDLTRPAGYPNGRDLDDPVGDILLSFLFLDFTVSGQSPMTFANLPLNPGGNDVPLRSTFPYLGQAQGTPPLAATTGTTFDFRTDPDSAYVNVDRMGGPAIPIALIGGPMRIAYNDANPTIDATGQFVAEETTQLNLLMNALADDLIRLGLQVCARRV